MVKKMANFFINRPVFAWVISIIIMLAGLFALTKLPISQYPKLSPPTISISASYPGADAQTLENSVTQIIEQSLTGLDGMMYFSSSSSNGSVRINVTFDIDTDPDIAQVQVQNKISQAINRLPEQIKEQGVNVRQSQSAFLMIASLYDTTNTKKQSELADYLTTNLQDQLSRVNGVGEVRVFGSQYSMRVWLDPLKLKEYSINPSEVANAIKTQNVDISAGKVGEQPMDLNQEFTVTVRAGAKYERPEQFENIIIKSNLDGSKIYLKDLSRVELGNENYSVRPKLNGLPASGIAIMLAPDANALDVSANVKEIINQIIPSLPEGYEMKYARDNTEFIKLSIYEVVETLFIAIGLVILVMFLFLQNIRATLVPAITVPIVILGTFAVLQMLGFSINTLTLFALVLSIGLLVDDSIVVVENVERIMADEGLGVKEATIKSMGEITSALIGIGAVLSAVFLPMAFFGGTSGVIYQQFSVAIVTSMMLSVIIAIMLTPTLCIMLLKERKVSTTGFFGAFNRGYGKLQDKYEKSIFAILKTRKSRLITVAVFIAIVSSVVFLFDKAPKGFIPNEDQGDVMVMFTLPSGSTLTQTETVSDEIRKYFEDNEGDNLKNIFTISGFNFSGSAENAGMAFLSLNDWGSRKEQIDSAEAIAGRAMMNFDKYKKAQVFALVPPAISDLGNSSGFTLNIQAIGDTSRADLRKIRDEVVARANQNKMLSSVRQNELSDTTQLRITIDKDKASSLGLSISDINQTLTYAWGGSYLSDFIDRGRVKKVYIKGDFESRSTSDDINKWHVRNINGEMVSFSEFATQSWETGPDSLSRYNGLSSFQIDGTSAAGISSGDAMDEMEKIISEYQGVLYEWSGLSYEEKQSSGKAVALYIVSILVVFLFLAALYESWSIPFSVILIIPLGILGALLAILFRGLENDVYFQVALLTTVGLSAKNSILIVEFAELHYKESKDIIKSSILASKERLRPILMTSLAFVAGVVPLAIATGAGANSRISIGTGVIGGTLSATFLVIFFVALFTVIIKLMTEKKEKKE